MIGHHKSFLDLWSILNIQRQDDYYYDVYKLNSSDNFNNNYAEDFVAVLRKPNFPTLKKYSNTKTLYFRVTSNSSNQIEISLE